MASCDAPATGIESVAAEDHASALTVEGAEGPNEADAAFHALVLFNATTIHVSDAGVVDTVGLGAAMPGQVPPALPPLAELVAALRTCDSDLAPDICHFELDELALTGFPVGVCGGAGVRFWSSSEPDAGVGEVSCWASDLPCCYFEDE